MKWLVIVWALGFACNMGQDTHVSGNTTLDSEAGSMFFHQWAEFTDGHIVTYLKCSYKTSQVDDTPPPFFIGIQDEKNKVFAQVSYSTEYVKIDPPWSERWEGIGHADGVFVDAYLTLTNHAVAARDGGKYYCDGRYKIENTNVVVHMNLTSLEFEVEETGTSYDEEHEIVYDDEEIVAK